MKASIRRECYSRAESDVSGVGIGEFDLAFWNESMLPVPVVMQRILPNLDRTALKSSLDATGPVPVELHQIGAHHSEHRRFVLSRHMEKHHSIPDRPRTRGNTRPNRRKTEPNNRMVRERRHRFFFTGKRIFAAARPTYSNILSCKQISYGDKFVTMRMRNQERI